MQLCGITTSLINIYSEDTEIQMVRSYPKSLWLNQGNFAGASSRNKGGMQTEKEVGRQHEELDKTGVWHLCKGHGKQRKMAI